ncbi:MAG: GNAT family N-acetyltransferase [Candidatus Eisenbacteria bacterium]
MITLRPALKSDETVLGRYGAALMRQHHASDPRRFILTDRPETGYGRFLVSELEDPDCLVMVAVESGQVVGYVFADVEGTSWRELRGPCGYIHDLYVDERVRRQGVGRELLRAAIAWIHSRGMTQVVLSSKSGNDSAQRLFAGFGFRRTMIEMTLDGEGPGPKTGTGGDSG